MLYRICNKSDVSNDLREVAIDIESREFPYGEREYRCEACEIRRGELMHGNARYSNACLYTQ